MIDKHGKVATYVLPAVTADIVTPLMVETVDSNTTLITDAHTAYRFLKSDFTHIVVKHSEGEYKNGEVFTPIASKAFGAFLRYLRYLSQS